MAHSSPLHLTASFVSARAAMLADSESTTKFVDNQLRHLFLSTISVALFSSSGISSDKKPKPECLCEGHCLIATDPPTNQTRIT